MWDILLTRECIKYFIPTLSSINCPLCDGTDETLLHLFIECPISRILWSQSNWLLNLSSLGLNSMKDWIQFILYPMRKLGLTSQEDHHFKIFAGLILGFIWRLRNDLVHNQKEFLLQKISLRLNLSYEENLQAWKENTNTKSGKKWQNPCTNHICISFDAVVRNSFSLALVVSRNSIGNVIEIWTEENPTITLVIAEALAAKLAFKMAEFINTSHISLVGDSQLVISSISKLEVIWKISTILDDIANSLNSATANPHVFYLHATLFCQAFTHCKNFITVTSHKSLGHVFIPVWLIILSDQPTDHGLSKLLPYQLTNRM
ncbi:hypothetical protein I3842_01G087100 [Carya illinoinensis]|uniref:Reverse transcriptase zinc-binding domain-containing protein n=1 Tax=Carya illinoinensis TaxID=32201 RepID=A0A922G393_CARIL|nr:hypothetical protein I3842_01G087100 [Carya illinoinensis]